MFTCETLYKGETWAHVTLLPNFPAFLPLFLTASPPIPTPPGEKHRPQPRLLQSQAGPSEYLL